MRRVVLHPLCLAAVCAGLAASGAGARSHAAPPIPSPPRAADTVDDGRGVLRRMHERYAGTWYRTLALIQSVTHFDTIGGIDHAEIWYESIALPGTVRSDIAPLDQGRGELFRGDSLFRFEADTITERGPAVHVILLLAFDVYHQPVDTTAAKLERYGFDLGPLRDSVWDGRAVSVVGAAGGPQFWVDRERLVLLRLVVPRRRDGSVRDIRFGGYEPLGGGWIATELAFLTDGQVRIRERYAWWDTGLAFAPGVFAIAGRSRPAWVRN